MYTIFKVYFFMIIRYVWELCYVESKRESNVNNSRFIKTSKSNMTSLKSGLQLSDLNGKKFKVFGHSFGINQHFNGGIIPFTLSNLVDKFSDNKNFHAIKELLNWKYLEKDVDLMQKLFDKKCFDEVSFLIYKKKYTNKWKITKEQFLVVIENEELDLILFFLKIRHCRVILEDHSVQKLIVEKYMKCGSKMYYGVEMLSYIYSKSWDSNLIKYFSITF